MFRAIFSLIVRSILTVFTASGIIHVCRCRMVSWMSWNVSIRISCRIRKATNKHSEYVILIVLPLQQWLHERVSMFRYTHIACLVCITKEKLSKRSLIQTCTLNGHLYRVTYTRCRADTIHSPDDGHTAARNI